MSEELPEKIRWDADFKRRVVAGVVSGLILLSITGVLGLIVTRLASLSAGDALLYVGLPVLVVVVLMFVGVVVRAQRQRTQQRDEWEQNISSHTVQLINVVRRMILKDLIHTAEVWEWRVVEDDDNDLLFIAPDNERHVVVATYYPSDREVAEELHEAAPEHFPEDWQDFTYQANVTAALAAKELEDVQEELRGMEMRLAQAALSTITGDALRADWNVDWFPDRVLYTKGSDTATVHYGDIDAARLREVMKLPGSPSSAEHG